MNMRRLLLIVASAWLLMIQPMTALAQQPYRHPLNVGLTKVLGDLNPHYSRELIVSHGIGENLYREGNEAVPVSRFIKEAHQQDDHQWELILQEGVKFSNGEVVTAQDLEACLSAQAPTTAFSFQALDSNRLEVTTPEPVANIADVLAVPHLLVYKQKDDAFIYTGPFQVTDYQPRNSVFLAPNTYYPQAEKRQDVHLYAIQDDLVLRREFESFDLDMIFPVSVTLKDQLDQEVSVTRPLETHRQYFLLVNQSSEIMGQADLRRALNLALDREKFRQALRGGHLPTGLFPTGSDYAGKEEFVSDPYEASKILDRVGWTLNRQGYRQKDGQVLTLSVTHSDNNRELEMLGQVLMSQLTKLGIAVDYQFIGQSQVDPEDTSADLVLESIHTLPLGQPEYFLNKYFAKTGVLSSYGYANDQIDDQLKALRMEGDSQKRQQIIQDIQIEVMGDLPLLPLLESQWHIATSERLGNYDPLPGDGVIIDERFGLRKD